MPKLDGGLDGNALAGQKRALEEKMDGAGGEMVVGRMATRSVTKAKKVGQAPMSSSESDALLFKMFREWALKNKKYYKTADEENERFKIWCSTKEWCEANTSKGPGGVKYGLTVFADMTARECGQRRGGGRRKLVDDSDNSDWEKSFWDSESGKALAEKKEAFFKWVAEHKKDYGDKQLMMFMCFSRNYKRIQLLRKENPGCYLTLPDELDMKMDHPLTMPEFHSLVNLKPAPSNN